MLNAVLDNILIYNLYFFKAPKVVVQELISMKCIFLWGEVDEVKKVCWTRWDDICKAKKDGGLGVKHVGRFNIALISKCLWWILVEKDNLWFRLLKERYGNFNYNILSNSYVSNMVMRKQSLWWRDISGIGTVSNPDVNWFNESIHGKVGEGNIIKLWKQVWINLKPLDVVFPDLFKISVTRSINISTKGA